MIGYLSTLMCLLAIASKIRKLLENEIKYPKKEKAEKLEVKNIDLGEKLGGKSENIGRINLFDNLMGNKKIVVESTDDEDEEEEIIIIPKRKKLKSKF